MQSAGIGSVDLESCLKNYLVGKNGKALPYLAVIHRLDQPVEGVLVFGKNPSAAKNLSRQITEGKMEKIYLAVTYGKPFAKEGILEDFLKKDGRTNTSAVVQKGTPGSKKARLTFQVLEECTDLLRKSKNGCCVFTWIQAGIIRSECRWLMREWLWPETESMEGKKSGRRVLWDCVHTV